MTTRITRRDALVGLGVVGAATVLRIDTDAQGQELTVAGQPVELRISSLSPSTVRISLFARGTAIDQLNAARARFIGVVLNKVNIHRHAYYYAPYYRKDYARVYEKTPAAR